MYAVSVLFSWFLSHLEYFWMRAAWCFVSSHLLTDVVSFMTTVLAEQLQSKLSGVFVCSKKEVNDAAVEVLL